MPPSPYVPIAQAAAAKYGVPEPVFLRQINAESAWNPNARSSAGAMGLLQLMPGTARSLGVTDPYDPHQSIEGGAKYMGQLLHEFGGNVKLALAAYNAGPGNVRNGAWQHIPETVAYVDHILQGLGAPNGHAGGQVAASPLQAAPPALSNADFNLLETLAQGGTPSTGQLLAELAGGGSPAPVSGSLELPPLPSAALAPNPVPGGKFERVDQGVDLMAPGPVHAFGSGVIESITKGMAGGTGDIIKERLDHPVVINGHTYDQIYYSEEKPLVRQGQRVAAGAPVMGAGGNELGFLDSQGRMAPLVGGLGAGTQPTAMGEDFLAFLRRLQRGL